MEMTHDARVLWEYNCLDCVTTARVYKALCEEVADLRLEDFYREVAHPLTLAVRRMANRGMYVDRTRVRRLQGLFDAKISKYEEGLRAITGDPNFNPNAPAAVGEYIFGTLGCKSQKKTKGGKESVDQLTLLKLGLRYESPFFKVLLAHRKMCKLRSTYLTKTYVAPDGRVRSRFLVHGTATGRLSSREPNFQNIPKERNAWFGLTLPNIRTIYIAEPGNVLVEADYSQLELRLIAYASKCKRLLDAYATGDDVHTLTAMSITGKPRDAISVEDRDFAKRFRFCQNYGGAALRISEILFEQAGIIKSVKECDDTLRVLRMTEPEVFTWREGVLEEAKKTRMIRNEFGRIRVTFARDDDLSGIAYNTPIQGTAADLINKAMIRLDRRGIPYINQVHDALISEVPEDKVDKTISIMREEMESPVDIFGYTALSFPVDIKVGTRWGALKKVA